MYGWRIYKSYASNWTVNKKSRRNNSCLKCFLLSLSSIGLIRCVALMKFKGDTSFGSMIVAGKERISYAKGSKLVVKLKRAREYVSLWIVSSSDNNGKGRDKSWNWKSLETDIFWSGHKISGIIWLNIFM